jgi:hypothetical protein
MRQERVFLGIKEFPHGVLMDGDSPLEGKVVLIGTGYILNLFCFIQNVEDALIVWDC